MRYVSGVLCALFAVAILNLAPQWMGISPASGRLAVEQAGPVILTGRARVIDGDTIEIAGRRVRLEGVDAPEVSQNCRFPDNRNWPAGRVAALRLEQWVEGRVVACRAVGRGSYGRLLGRCTVGGAELNERLVREGLAWAFRKYSESYVREEEVAKRIGAGVWAASCQSAWVYRNNRWRDVAGRAPEGCAIKGNISRGGRIYHMPWSPWYGRTRIEPEKGERWFCDERQALAAGWRPALVR